MSEPTEPIPYDLSRLFADQDVEWFADTIAPLLAWVPRGTHKLARQPFRFPIEHTRDSTTRERAVDLTWSDVDLEARIPGVLAHAKRLRSGKSAQREHITELAAYALSFVAISIFLPGRRVVAWGTYLAPDILLDTTPNALRGVEVAGRTTGGRTALRRIRDGSPGKPGKRAELLERTDIVEVHLALWCGSPRLGIMEHIEP